MATPSEDVLSDKVKSVANYVNRADLSDEEMGQLIGVLIAARLAAALTAGIGDLGAD